MMLWNRPKAKARIKAYFTKLFLGSAIPLAKETALASMARETAVKSKVKVSISPPKKKRDPCEKIA